jgi:hypothetical protein
VTETELECLLISKYVQMEGLLNVPEQRKIFESLCPAALNGLLQ